MPAPRPENIFLAGMMGSGKSSVGPQLARELGWTHLDLDRKIEERQRMKVRQIFERQGEAAFRRMESEMLEEICQGRNQVVALGGGAVLAEANRALMASRGLLVYLSAEIETLAERVGYNPTARPLLAGKPPEAVVQRLSELLSERERFYQEAKLTVKTDHLNVRQIAAAILKEISG